MRFVRLFLMAFFCALALNSAGAQTYDIIQERNGLINVFARLKAAQPVRILFITGPASSGGDGWEQGVAAWFKRQYPRASVEKTVLRCSNAGAQGAAALWPVIAGSKPDLVFVNTADQDDLASSESALEVVGINAERLVRQIRSDYPAAEICFTYGLRKEMLAAYKIGRLPKCIFQHEVSAAHYRVSAINFGAAAAEQIISGKQQYSDLFDSGGVPTVAESAQAVDLITGFLAQLSLRVGRGVLPYRVSAPIEAASTPFSLAKPDGASLPGGWSEESASVTAPGISAFLTATTGSAPLVVKFDGTTVVLLIAEGAQSQSIQIRIDGGAAVEKQIGIGSAGSIHAIALAENLSAGTHTLELKTGTGSAIHLAGIAAAGGNGR